MGEAGTVEDEGDGCGGEGTQWHPWLKNLGLLTAAQGRP
jgi:hypothetical protein